MKGRSGIERWNEDWKPPVFHGRFENDCIFNREGGRNSLYVATRVSKFLDDEKRRKIGVFAKGLRIQDEMNGIPRMTQEKQYKYLGIEMEETSQTRTLNERMKEVKGKLEEIKCLRASWINTIRMINSMVISKLRNTFAAIQMEDD